MTNTKGIKIFWACIIVVLGLIIVLTRDYQTPAPAFVTPMLIILIGAFLLIYLVNLIIHIRNQRRQKIDAQKIEENIIQKKIKAENDYQGYYRSVKKHLIYGDLYFAFIIILELLIFISICLLANPAFSYFYFFVGIILYLTISIVIGEGEPVYNPFYELTENEFPELWNKIKKVAKDVGIEKPIKCYFGMDCNASVNETDKRITIFLGVILLHLMNEEELESILYHEFAHIVNNDTKRSYLLLRKLEKWMIVLDSKKTSKYLISILFSPLSTILSTDYQLFDFVSRRSIERIADMVIKERSNGQTFINALAKITLYSFFENEEAYPVTEVYEEDEVPSNYYNILINKFFEFYHQNKTLWHELIQKRIPAQVESHLTFKARMELMGVDSFQISFDQPISELEKIVKRANEVIVHSNEATYQERRNRDYLEPRSMIEQYEQHPEAMDRLELFSVAHAYRIFNKFNQAMAIYDEILANYPEHPQALFEKGTLMLSMFNHEGINLIYEAIGLNENYLEVGVNLIGEYCLKMGLEDELARYRQYRKEMANYYFNVHLKKVVYATDRLVPTALDRNSLFEVIKHIKEDNRIDKVYIADKIIDKYHRTTIVGYTIKKGYEDQKRDIYEYIFDYLDNDRREQFTLLALDEIPFFIKKFKALKGSLYYQSKD